MLLFMELPLRASDGTDGGATSGQPPVQRIDINEYRIEGATKLSAVEIESVVYPFLGPGRELKDIEYARAALEKKYADLGYHAVSVAIPPQKVRNGVVVLKVTEAKVERTRVKGSRWYSIEDIKRLAPSMAEGSVPNFNDVMKDIVVLNQLPDRQVIPELRAGAAPATVDVDLMVKDRFPLHASLELNNRYSISTPPMRLNGGVRYDNLWQLGHSIGFSFQVSPEVEAHKDYFHIKEPSQKVFSLTYVARIPTLPWLSFTLNGVLQDSSVSTLGAFDVVGNGKIAGVRSIFALPAASGFSHNISVGLDYKEFKEKLTITQNTTTSSAATPSDTTQQSTIYTPVNYLTLSAQYLFAWAGQSTQANFSTSLLFNLRPLSSGGFDNKRLNASANFTTFHLDASITQDIFLGMQVFARGYGQYTNQPLISSEQIVAGGVTSVRGYLEAEAAGDYGAVGTIELRGPDLADWFGKPVLTAWRFYVFTDGGWLKIYYPSAEQKGRFSPSSIGGGTRLGLFETLQASLDVGLPLAWMGTAGATKTHQVRLQFSVLGKF